MHIGAEVYDNLKNIIKKKYGKNAILKGVNYDPAAIGRERNLQIGGHKSNG